MGWGEAFTSPMTDFRRFSNSPLTSRQPAASPVQCPNRHVLQRPGNVAFGNAQGEALHHGGLADARFSVMMGLFCLRRVRISITCRIQNRGPELGRFSSFSSEIHGVLIEGLVCRSSPASATPNLQTEARGHSRLVLGSAGRDVGKILTERFD
jgi:hypothetical protein